MKYLVLLFSLLFAMPVQAKWNFLDRYTLHANPLANPRSPALGISVNTSKYKDQRVIYVDAVLGGHIGIITLYVEDFHFQLGVEAGGWLTLGWKGETTFAMLTEDFLISVPISFKYKDFVVAFKWNHISAHLGDGMSSLLEDELKGKKKKEFEFYEEIAEDEGMDLNLIEPFAYSRDFISIFMSYEFNVLQRQSRAYLQTGYSYKMYPEDLKKWFLGVGFEIKWMNMFYSPYSALDITYNQDTNSMDVSAQIGYMIRPDWNTYALYIALNGYWGKDRRGQLCHEDLTRYGIGLYVR